MTRIASALAVTFVSGVAAEMIRPVLAQGNEAVYSKTAENGLPPVPEVFFTREKIVLREQTYNLTCEFASARMAAEWFYRRNGEKLPRIESCQDLEDFFRINTPLNDNPFKGFRGDYDGLVSIGHETGEGYGVYPPPVVENFGKLGIPAQAIIWQTREESAEKLKQMMEESFIDNQVWLVWIAPDGGEVVYENDQQTKEKYPLVLGEHCVAMQVQAGHAYLSADRQDRQAGQFGRYAEIFDPYGYCYPATFEYLLGKMKNLGLLMAVRVG